MAPSTATTQKRLLTQPTSKLAKSNITTILRKDTAWSSLPEEVRMHLYTLLPPPENDQAPHNPNVHPLTTPLKPYIEEELRRYQEDLKDGREARMWRLEAMHAGRDRLEGQFDEAVAVMREEYWGIRKDQGSEKLDDVVAVADKGVDDIDGENDGEVVQEGQLDEPEETIVVTKAERNS